MTDTDEGYTYRVVRMFFEDDIQNRVIARGLTLDEAQAHCNDPETSSSTATNPPSVQMTENFGPWFDGYERES